MAEPQSEDSPASSCKRHKRMAQVRSCPTGLMQPLPHKAPLRKPLQNAFAALSSSNPGSSDLPGTRHTRRLAAVTAACARSGLPVHRIACQAVQGRSGTSWSRSGLTVLLACTAWQSRTS